MLAGHVLHLISSLAQLLSTYIYQCLTSINCFRNEGHVDIKVIDWIKSSLFWGKKSRIWLRERRYSVSSLEVVDELYQTVVQLL